MLNLLPRLFGENRLLVQGIAESHPAVMLNTALSAIGANFDGGPEDGPIDNDYLRKMANNPRVETSYWDSWKWLILDFTENPVLRRYALEKVEQAQKISLAERKIIEAHKPKILYIEGCSDFPSSVVGFVAEKQGTKVIYLDEDFQPYREWQESRFKLDLSYVQKGREAHWAARVVTNKPRGNSLLIAGRNHLITPTQGSVEQNPSRKHIGKFPDLLRMRGVEFEMYVDLSEPRTGTHPYAGLYPV